MPALSHRRERKSDNIFLTVCADRALSEARAAETRYRDGRPLSPPDGVPFAWKDIFDVAGTPTTAGSILLKDAPPKTIDMLCVANAVAAGTVTLGKLNLTEFRLFRVGPQSAFRHGVQSQRPENAPFAWRFVLRFRGQPSLLA